MLTKIEEDSMEDLGNSGDETSSHFSSSNKKSQFHKSSLEINLSQNHIRTFDI